MKKTVYQQNKILEILRANWLSGINSKYFYTTELIPRYPQRMRELREKGYEFATKREEVGGSNLQRIWMIYDVLSGHRQSIPYKARVWGKLGTKPIEFRKPTIVYRFEGNMAIPM